MQTNSFRRAPRRNDWKHRSRQSNHTTASTSNSRDRFARPVHQASESDIRVLVVQAEGPHFSFGGEVREWPGKDVNWFRTFVAEVNLSYRSIEALRDSHHPLLCRAWPSAAVSELALNCDFIVAQRRTRSSAALKRAKPECCRSQEPLLSSLPKRIGRSRASHFAMLGEPVPGSLAGASWEIATHVVLKPSSRRQRSLGEEARCRANKSPTRRSGRSSRPGQQAECPRPTP